MTIDQISIDKVSAYAMALDSDIGAERYQVVDGGKLVHYWMGTVYGCCVSAEDGGHKCLTKYDALQQARRFIERCAAIVSERACTCHPDDKPPVPCAKKFAYSECAAAPATQHTETK